MGIESESQRRDPSPNVVIGAGEGTTTATDDDATHGRKPKPNDAIDVAIRACLEEGDFDGATDLIAIRRKRDEKSRAVNAKVIQIATRLSR